MMPSMSPVLWFAFIMLAVSAVCFVTDAFLNLGKGAGSSDARNVQRNAKTPFPPVSGGGAGGREVPDGFSAPVVTPPSVSSLPDVLRPIGGLPSWESTRRER